MQLSDLKDALPFLALLISLAAFAISLWTRIESYASLKRQRHIDLVRRVGEAFNSAQQAKNELSDLIDRLKEMQQLDSSQLSLPERLANTATLERCEADYKILWDLIGTFEHLLIHFERGGKVPLEQSVIEAKIARYGQIRVLAQHDLAFAEKVAGRQGPNNSLKRTNQSLRD